MKKLTLLIIVSFWAANVFPVQLAPNISVALEMSTDGTTWSPIDPGQQTITGSVAHFRASISLIDGVDANAGLPVTVNFSEGGGTADVTLKGSSDLENWATAQAGDSYVGSKKFFRAETDSAFSLILAGTFTMGSPAEESGRNFDETQHAVTFVRGRL